VRAVKESLEVMLGIAMNKTIPTKKAMKITIVDSACCQLH